MSQTNRPASRSKLKSRAPQLQGGPTSPTTYELYAIKYAELDRPALEHFVFRDVHDGPMPLDYFVWVARSPELTFVIDTGFFVETGARRNRRIIRNPREGLARLDIDPARIEDVDHHAHAPRPYRQLRDLSACALPLQDREMASATGRHMCHARLRMPFDIENVTGMVREVYRGRVAFHDGADERASGISLHLVGGHSDGLQFVRVHTERGWVVLASDAIHFYANVETGNPFPIVFDVGDMMEGWARCRRLADGKDHVVPGHDPLVRARYPAPSPELEGIAVRLDVAPAER